MAIYDDLKAQISGNTNEDITMIFQFLQTQKKEDTFIEAKTAADTLLDSLSQPVLTKTDDPLILKEEKKKAFNTYLYILKTYIDKQFFEEALTFAIHGENRVKKEMKRVCKEWNNNSIVFRFCFSPMEYALTDLYFSSPADDILALDYVSLLVLQGQACFYLRRFDEARSFFRKALEFDPVSPELSFFLADIDMQNNNWISYSMDLDKVYSYCYRQEDLKRYYRYLARYYHEYVNDHTMYMLLYHLGDSKVTSLYDQYQQLTDEEKELLNKEKIRYDVSEEVIDTLAYKCSQALKQDNIPMYKYFFSIFKKYRTDVEINELIHKEK